MASLNDRVVPLNQLEDYEVAEGDPDVRGWEVLASDGRSVGRVEELIVDKDALKVRYLEVGLGDDLFDSASGRAGNILIPIGNARLDQADDRIFVDSMDSSGLASLPAFTAGPITRDYESEIRGRFDSSFTDSRPDSDFYAHELYDEDRFYEPRRETMEDETRLTLAEEELDIGRNEHFAGEVEIDKKVDTRHIREDVPVHHEEVVVEHREPSDMRTSARIEEDEIHIPVMEEELSVERRTVPREELVVKKQDVVDDEIVEADLRRERAEIHREGDVRIRDDEDEFESR